MAQKLLIIDDNADIGEFVCAAAKLWDWHCTTTTTAADFMASLSDDTTLIFLDLMMPEIDGIEMLRLLAQQHCQIGIVLMSGVGQRVLETANELAGELGLFIVAHLRKPFQLRDLETILTRPRKPRPIRTRGAASANVIANNDLRSAIDNNQFVVHYQPQIDMRTGKIVALEALARWQHPQKGLIFPDDFIARLEIMGWIGELGSIVARDALSHAGRFAEAYGEMPAISINVSVLSLVDLKFPDSLLGVAAQCGVPADKITVEITETGLIEELSKTLDVLARLRMKGVQISIDDFGTGYSMMQQLRRIPATELKIDRSFIHNMQNSDGDRIIVQKTIEMGHELGMQVVVEGVETSAQLEFLRISGGDIAQGYLFTRPLPPEAAIRWLKDYRSTLQQRSA
jgi:EAL domain-containing protein (putative c-di-GMP-specific phosphodiesterase class I)